MIDGLGLRAIVGEHIGGCDGELLSGNGYFLATGHQHAERLPERYDGRYATFQTVESICFRA